ncbi:hypothetical protein Tc00.1047053511303.20 [Trypanosoma cruzi]|uniref:Uncharacterized protein n=1 Tax=Trypanosoma cruzi (strain CL Brener) TaxID=353153 RepID=Q4DSL7_TRYCC|nr:hypothetical protein Tc00.1047053511303.20 [Trypanosoma cruzi]EAN95502.1 hypothetical protein Tc00.1047053511303.20 [Trypanosoma cruzi]|eukprot:XP_817353.1 hypothetical protein [Trypanosoma cruzi strain CL Brener]
MAERRSPTLLCWDACLQYELSQAEVWAELRTGASSMSNWLGRAAMPSITDETAMVALRHVACDYLAATREELAETLYNFKREITKMNTDVGAERFSLQEFMLLLGPLTLVANAESVLQTFWNEMLQRDKLCARCVSEAYDACAALQLQEQTAREELLSSCRRWQLTRQLQDRLRQQREHLSTLHSLDEEGVADRVKISSIRRAVRVEEERQQQQFAEKALEMDRIACLTDTLEMLHNQLRVAEEYEALTVDSLLREQSDRVADVALEASRKIRWDSRLSHMERQVGILGRFAVGLSLVRLGRHEHDAILRRMEGTSTCSAATTTTAMGVAASPAAGDLTWLVGDDADATSSYYATTAASATMPGVSDTGNPSSLPVLLQQCLFDPSYYKAKSDVSSERGRQNPSADDYSEVEDILRQVFGSLTQLIYVAIPFLQGFAATIDTVVLFPSFELFLNTCEMNVLGSSKLAFLRHCSHRLDADIVNYLKLLVRAEGSWVVEHGMRFEDFVAFLVDQAALEYVRHAYFLTTKKLLTKIVLDIVLPKWVRRLKKGKTPPFMSLSSNCSKNEDRVDNMNRVLLEKENIDDLCLLLDTALAWLGIASRSLEQFAQAYRKHVLEYAFAMKPETKTTGITTTQALMALLFPKKGESLQLRCHPTRWDALQRTQGFSFAQMNALVGEDGSLDSVTAWLTLGLAGINREELMRRIVEAIESILRANLKEDINVHVPHDQFSVSMSYSTPVSWILTLAVCVHLSFNSNLVTCGLDKLFQLLTVST